MKKFTNPIIPTETDGHTADPYVIRHDGYYFHCCCRLDGIYISRSSELCDIGSGEEFKVFDAPISGNMSQWYAPELHQIDGEWYIYASPLVDEKKDLHTMCVLHNKSDNPIGSYEFLGVVKGLENTWSIDGTIMEHDGDRWFIWTNCAEMFMTKMDSPTSITGPHISLMKPELEFETKCGLVNEGPAVLYRNGKTHIVFSANDSKYDDYCLGIMSHTDGDIDNPSNWTKHSCAVFEKTDSIYGPGHCSFTTVDENDEIVDYIVYHANLQSGSGWTGRSVWIQPFEWDDNDMPVFGKPKFNPTN